MLKQLDIEISDSGEKSEFPIKNQTINLSDDNGFAESKTSLLNGSCANLTDSRTQIHISKE
jgi:hypothetical protein